jgi:hypothetical protein
LGPRSPTPKFQKYNAALKKDLLEQEEVEQEKAKRDTEDERSKAEEVCTDVHNIIMPKYERDDILSVDREFEIPPPALFLGLGWDEDSETKRRHYRRFYNCDLEKEKSVLPNESPFNQYDLKRG